MEAEMKSELLLPTPRGSGRGGGRELQAVEPGEPDLSSAASLSLGAPRVLGQASRQGWLRLRGSRSPELRDAGAAGMEMLKCCSA